MSMYSIGQRSSRYGNMMRCNPGVTDYGNLPNAKIFPGTETPLETLPIVQFRPREIGTGVDGVATRHRRETLESTP